MDPSIPERLGLRPAGGPQNRERAERAMAARSLMYLFLVGTLMAAVALVSPVSGEISPLRIASMGACSALIALLLFAGYDRLPAWALSVFLLCGSMLIQRASRKSWTISSAMRRSTARLIGPSPYESVAAPRQ